ncbi:basic proline-rich protein [Streptomyces himastatinicus ATCC 53653]|uniref:Basic proline-rich protein n=1 Tax=Streptomyces himastatinicus ATCC 53653 TaxID=457427 RepID=D9WJ32_9ACTN|nr:baseplate J/gp47 family protein [Streptomyces himastatinicus]EFL29129.1 basic proline-rich protein [Streptomyces himastatinicus ATCC 53653]
MTLPAPKLDDLTWADMMAAIRRRIPAESDGTWTLHAPVDPGVTLLELFAYLLEQRLYWLDQVPDALVVAILRLLGLEPPRPARPAATVLRLAARQEDTAVPVVPAGTALTRDPTGRIVFTLDHDVAAFPLAEGGEISVWTDRDRTADLRARRGIALLASDGAPARARFTLPLTGAHPAPGPISLLAELDAPAACVPSWLPGAVDGVPPPAELTWSWFRPGTDISGTFEKVEDGTAGLRRSGVVRLHPPADWTTQDTGLEVSTPAATYAAPPRLLQLAVNVSAAHHRTHRTADGTDLQEQIGAWLRLPGQHLVLPDAADRLLEATLRLAGQEWQPVPDFTFGAPADRIFVLDRDEGALVFGDGLTGRVPRPDPDVRVDYVTGGGRDGNGGMTGNWLPAADIPAAEAVSAANLVRAEGGADPETVTEARRRAAASLGEVTRAVTADDYVTLARTTPGVAVARAYPALGEHPGFPCATVPGAVTVHIVPAAPRATSTARTSSPRRSPTRACCARSPPAWNRRGCSPPRSSSEDPATAMSPCASTCPATPPTAPAWPPRSPPRCAASSTRWSAATTRTAGPSDSRCGPRPCCAPRSGRWGTSRTSPPSASASTGPTATRRATKCRSAPGNFPSCARSAPGSCPPSNRGRGWHDR